MRRENALIVGFLGRGNSGDDLMFELHRDLLRRLGFKNIAWWTEFPQHSRIGVTYCSNTVYDLVLVGGGTLDYGFGMMAIQSQRFRHGSKVIYSSFSYPRGNTDDRYVRLLQSTADLIILRNRKDFEEFPEKSQFLPDISTTCQPPARMDRTEIAVVVRDTVNSFLDFAPADPFDVLVLSVADRAASMSYAQRAGARSIHFLETDHPSSHVAAIRRYQRVVSFGRLHPALYAAPAADVLYLFGSVPLIAPGAGAPPNVQHVSWSRLAELAREHRVECKLGVPTTDLKHYGTTTMDDYMAAFESVLSPPPSPDISSPPPNRADGPDESPAIDPSRAAGRDDVRVTLTAGRLAPSVAG